MASISGSPCRSSRGSCLAPVVIIPGHLPDRPLGHFSDGKGCLTHAEGLPGVGGHMDGVHGMGPGAIMFTLLEHFRLTGDLDWLRSNSPRMKANAEWILRQRRLLASLVPGGERLWSKGLQPAHVVTPDSERMHMQYLRNGGLRLAGRQATGRCPGPDRPGRGRKAAAAKPRPTASICRQRSIARSC